ncbi:hypothetical protein [Piscirickettsia salmonis]|uniref:hypothetical protein n=1 Tax=Piscirickettsia salmonis TaxID=1238 RepID=UPI001E491054|nr:hypothetical protein [Piscirickettsia salmonis]
MPLSTVKLKAPAANAEVIPAPPLPSLVAAPSPASPPVTLPPKFRLTTVCASEVFQHIRNTCTTAASSVCITHTITTGSSCKLLQLM